MTPPARFDFDGEYGARYDDVIGRVFPAYACVFPIVTAHLDGLVPSDGAILVVGAGTGAEVLAFADWRPSWRLTALDPSAQMLAAARRKLAARALADRVTLVHGYAHDLPERPAFDAATAISVMHFLPDDGTKLEFLRGIAGRLRGGAVLVLVDAVGEPGSEALEAALADWMRYVRVMGLSPDEQLTYREQVRNDVRFVAEERILELLAQAGFSPVTPFFRALTFRGWIARKT